MSRQMLVIQAALPAALVGMSGCQEREVELGTATRHVVLGQSDFVWWTEVTKCSEDDAIPSELVMGTGLAEGYAWLLDDQGNDDPAMGYLISAPSDTDSFAMVSCGLRARFPVDPDPTLGPEAVQAVLGSVALEVQHAALVGDARSYELAITLSVSGGVPKVTRSAEVIYCLADEFMYCWWDTPYMDVCQYEGAGCNDPYPSEGAWTRLEVTDVTFEAGQTYTVDLEVSGWISSISGRPDQGGQIDFDFMAIGDPQVLFGI